MLKLIMVQPIHLLPSRLFVPPAKFFIPTGIPYNPKGQVILEQAQQILKFSYKNKKGRQLPSHSN
jgi:hypothetical protein